MFEDDLGSIVSEYDQFRLLIGWTITCLRPGTFNISLVRESDRSDLNFEHYHKVIDCIGNDVQVSLINNLESNAACSDS